MSYIRSGSNPEKLFVWGDRSRVHFWVGDDTSRSMTNSSFRFLLMKYIKSYRELPCQTRVASVTEGEHFKVQLNVKGWSSPIIMWPVTWEYIVDRFKERME